jgi:hypothetical protein
MGMRDTDFPTVESRQAAYLKIAQEMSHLSGVAAASVVDVPPGYPLDPNCSYAADPGQLADGQSTGFARGLAATEGFLSTLEIHLVAGSDFIRTVQPNEPNYAIVNQSLADRLWPNHDAVGRPLFVRYGLDPHGPVTSHVVRGVVQDYRAAGSMQTNIDSIYTAFERTKGFFAFLMVRGKNGVPDFKSIHDRVRDIDSRVALYFPDTMQHQIDLTLSPVRLTTKLTTLFALAAAVLCAVGIYSLTVAQIMQRSREFGIRMALGIEPQRLWTRFTRSYLVATACGIAIGLAAALPTVRLLKSLVFGVNPYSAAPFALVAAGILIITFVACIPCLFRLVRIHPADCLRNL